MPKPPITKKDKKKPEVTKLAKKKKETEKKEVKAPKDGKIKRMKTGIFGLDEFLAGGLPMNSTILILGEPGTGKSTLAFHFIYAGLKKGESCVFISTSETHKSLVQTMAAIGLDHIAQKAIFIDCYSWRLGVKSKAKYSISQPTDLNQLSLAIDKALGEDKEPHRIVFDSLSDIMLHVKPEVATKFIQVISAKVKKSGGVGIFTLEKGMHEDKYVKTLVYLTDGIIEMSVEKNRRKIKIKKMAKTLHTLKPITFKISIGKGLGVEMSEFFK